MDDLDRLKYRYNELENRVHRIERGLFSVVTLLAVGLLVVGLFQPYFVRADRPRRADSELGFLRSVFSLSDSGIYEAERHPVAIGIVVGLYLLAALVAMSAALMALITLDRTRVVLLMISAVILVGGTVGSWLLQGMIHGSIFASPATVWFSGAAVLAVLSALFGRYIIDAR